jgi:hypothetical protein
MHANEHGLAIERDRGLTIAPLRGKVNYVAEARASTGKVKSQSEREGVLQGKSSSLGLGWGS